MKLLVIAAMLVGATAMAEVKFGASMATSMKNTSKSGDMDGQFNFDQGIFTVTGGSDMLSFFAKLKYKPLAATTATDNFWVSDANMTYKTAIGTWAFGRMGASNTGYESGTIGNNNTWSISLTGDANYLGATDGVTYGRDLGFAALEVRLGNMSNNAAQTDENKRKLMELSLTGKAMDNKMEWFFGNHMGSEGATSAIVKHDVMNLWLSYMLSDAMGLGFEYLSLSATPDGGDAAKASAMTLWANYKMDAHTFTFNYSNLTEADDSNIYDSTTGVEKHTRMILADKFKLEDNLSLYAEYKMDSADEDYYTDADGEPTSSNTTMTVGLAAKF